MKKWARALFCQSIGFQIYHLSPCLYLPGGARHSSLVEEWLRNGEQVEEWWMVQGRFQKSSRVLCRAPPRRQPLFLQEIPFGAFPFSETASGILTRGSLWLGCEVSYPRTLVKNQLVDAPPRTSRSRTGHLTRPVEIQPARRETL